MALRKIVSPSQPSALHLFRQICREVPRVLTIYDVDMSVKEARKCVRDSFREHAFVEDARTVERLLFKAKLELDEAILQYKTKAQLMAYLEKRTTSLKQAKQLSDEEYNFFKGGLH